MLISTKGRYALRVMLDLAKQGTGKYIPLKDIADRENISVKYLENILASLSRVKMVDAVRGKGGGYRLSMPPAEYSVGEIVRLAEGDLAAVSCLRNGSRGCERAENCLSLHLWEGLDKVVKDYLNNYSLADLLKYDSYHTGQALPSAASRGPLNQ